MRRFGRYVNPEGGYDVDPVDVERERKEKVGEGNGLTGNFPPCSVQRYSDRL